MFSKQNKSMTIGILGAGQLARMSAIAAKKLSHRVHIYAENNGSEPACELAEKVVVGKLNDLTQLNEFAKTCDVLTLENEFIDGKLLEDLQTKSGVAIYPSPKTFQLIEDKITEKTTFQNAHIPVVPFAAVNSSEDILAFAKTHGWPLILKSAKGGYDGYGNFLIKSSADIEKGIAALGGPQKKQLMVEAYLDLKKEVAIQVARNANGFVTYPVCETVQKNHICHLVFSPALEDETTKRKIMAYALQAIEAIDGVGIYAFEFFIDKKNQIFLNESAPRPHNSGHYSIEACRTSQFENHIRAVTGDKLGQTNMKYPFAVMTNLLGTQEGTPLFKFTEPIPENIAIHNYQKLQSKIGRKMGHITAYGDDLESLKGLALKLSANAKI
ncbi:MAG: 5-(carboxyamino)imidazole ribonucleotide synthase [Bacteriovoracaceae bacterium]|nr:5-(carboxyamino)imidazole ribonucleotide synthase [Bacteriovoracaceae bacterium]